MADRISVECPGCLAKVTLPDSSKLGKKVKCPKCSDVFVAEAADDEESDEADDDAPAQSKGRKRPAASAAAGAKGGKKRKPSGSGGGGGGSNGPLIAGGAVAVLALVGVGLWLSGVFSSQPVPAPPVVQAQPIAPAPVVANAPPAPPAISPTERMLALRWLPQDTELILHVKVADLWQAPLLKGLIDSPSTAEGVKDFQKATGLMPTDVESVTMGLGDLMNIQPMIASSMLGMPLQPPKAVVIVRTKKPVSIDDILKSEADLKVAEYKSKKYVESTTQEYCGWLAEPSTLIMGKADDLKAVIDRGETVIPRKELMFADATPQLIVLLAPKNPTSAKGTAKPVPGLSPELAALQKTIDESLLALSVGVNIRGGLDVQTSLLMKDNASATTAKSGMESGMVEARKAFESFKMSGQPLLVELGEQLLSNLKVDTKDQVVKVATNLPDSDQQKIEQVPPLLMMMAMTGGMGGGGGALAGPPKTMSGFPGGAPAEFKPSTMADGNYPGQTEPVAAQLAEGLPEGTTLSAMASWSQFPTLVADLKSTYPLQLIIDLKGDDLHEICGFGQVSLKTLSLAGGGTLKVSKTQSLVHASVVKILIPFEPGDGISFDHPEGTLRLIIAVDQSGAAANTLTAMEGTFKILTAEDSEEFTIEEAPKTAKRPLMDPGLKAAGVKLVKSNDTMGEALTLSCGKGFFLGKVKANNPESQDQSSNMSSHSEVEKTQTVQKLIAIGNNGKFVPQLNLQGKVFKGVKEKTITFKFADVALPTAETRPVPTQGNLPQQPNGAGFPGQTLPGQPMPGQP